jgi:hypothetical protein
MRQVTRYKCDFCKKLAAKPETIERHELVCVNNPNGKNCYMCEYAYMDDYEPDDPYSTSIIKNAAMCGIYEDILRENQAPNCHDYKHLADMYTCRTHEDVEKAIDKMEGYK